jgi:hypothetical protein
MRRNLVLTLLIGLFAAATATAGEFVADTTSNVSLKAPGGYFQENTYEITPTGPTALRARITVSKFEDHPQWVPSFSFGVTNGDDASFTFGIARLEPGRLTTFFRRYVKGDDKTVVDFAFEPREGEAFTLLMEWTPEGKVRASVGRDGQMEQHEAEFGLPPQTVRVLASGGTLDITPLELGHMEALTTALPASGSFRPSSAPRAQHLQSAKKACALPLSSGSPCNRRR